MSWDKESQAEYARRHSQRDRDAGDRARRAEGLIPSWVMDGIAHNVRTPGPFARMGEEILAKEDSERVTPTRAESDLEWELR